jgi:phosphoribosyl 1,2-cyclic phosphodiesterase
MFDSIRREPPCVMMPHAALSWRERVTYIQWMRVTFHGVRGSVPTPGPTTVRYGGNTSCVDVRLADGSIVILDAGTGVRALGERIMREGIPKVLHLLITHSHWDHIIGAPFFKPIWSKEADVRIYTFSDSAFERVQHPVLFDGVHFPIKFESIPCQIERIAVQESELRIGSALIRRIRLNHPGGSDGFRIDDDGGASMCFLTDNELRPPGPMRTPVSDIARFAEGTGLMIHDAQYTPEDMPAKLGWGHSMVHDALALGRDAEARITALYHHEPERDDDALDAIAEDARAWAHDNAREMQAVVAHEGLSIEIP